MVSVAVATHAPAVVMETVPATAMVALEVAIIQDVELCSKRYT